MALIKCKVQNDPINLKSPDGTLSVNAGVITSTLPGHNSAIRAINKSITKETTFSDLSRKEMTAVVSDKGKKIMSKLTNTLDTKTYGDVHTIVKRITDSHGIHLKWANNKVESYFEPLNKDKTLINTLVNYLNYNRIATLHIRRTAELVENGETAVKGYYAYNDYLKKEELEHSREVFDNFGDITVIDRDNLKAMIDNNDALTEALARKKAFDDDLNSKYTTAFYKKYGRNIENNFYIENYVMVMVDRAEKIQRTEKKDKKEIYNFEQHYGTNLNISKNIPSLEIIKYAKQLDEIVAMEALGEIQEKYDISKTYKATLQKKITDKINDVTNLTLESFSPDTVMSFRFAKELLIDDKSIPQKIKDTLTNDLKGDNTKVIKVLNEAYDEAAINELSLYRENVNSPEYKNVKEINPHLKELYDFLENGNISNETTILQQGSQLARIMNTKMLAPGSAILSNFNKMLQNKTTLNRNVLQEAMDKGDINLNYKSLFPEGYTIVNKHGIKFLNKDGSPLSGKQMGKAVNGFFGQLSNFSNSGMTAKNIYDNVMLIAGEGHMQNILADGEYMLLPDNIADAIFEQGSDYMTAEQRNSFTNKINGMFRKNILTSLPRVLGWAKNNKIGEFGTVAKHLPKALWNYPLGFKLTQLYHKFNGDIDLMFSVEGKVNKLEQIAKKKDKKFDKAKQTEKAEKFMEKYGQFKGVAEHMYSSLASEIAFLQKDLKLKGSTKEIREIEKIISELATDAFEKQEAKGKKKKSLETIKRTPELWDWQSRTGQKAFEKLEFSPRLAMAMTIQKDMIKKQKSGKKFLNYGAADRNVINALLKAGKIDEAAVTWANRNFMDYSETPNVVKWLNARYVPFVNFTYHVARNMSMTQYNYFQNIKESYQNKSGEEMLGSVSRALWGEAVMFGIAATAWNMAMAIVGLYDEDENPPPSYMLDRLSITDLLGLDSYTYIPFVGHTNKTHLADTMLDFVPVNKDGSGSLVENTAGIVAGKLYPHAKMPFEILFGVDFMGGSIVPVSPDVTPIGNVISKVGVYAGSPVTSSLKYVEHGKNIAGMFNENSEIITQANHWDLARKMKYEFKDDGSGYQPSNYGYGNAEDKHKYKIKQSLKTADIEHSKVEIGAYAEYLKREGKTDEEISKKITSLIDSQSIFFGLSDEKTQEFVSGLTDKQKEIVQSGIYYEQYLMQQLGL